VCVCVCVEMLEEKKYFGNIKFSYFSLENLKDASIGLIPMRYEEMYLNMKWHIDGFLFHLEYS